MMPNTTIIPLAMDHSPFYFLDLYDLLMSYEGTQTYADVLAPWAEANSEARDWLQAFAARTGSPVPQADTEDLWDLYRLSVVGDILLNGLPARAVSKNAWKSPPLSLRQFQQFFESLGMTGSCPASYTPFHHEIVAVTSSDDPDAPPTVLACEWPCLMLGPMVFLRAGTRVSAGKNVLAPGIADRSTIYWTYCRRNRPALDLSRGWGSNSRWRTAFRRDYQFDNLLYFNVDGSLDLSDAQSLPRRQDKWTRAQAIELLVNRHFITSPLAHDDLFPYDYSLRTHAQSLTALYAPGPSTPPEPPMPPMPPKPSQPPQPKESALLRFLMQLNLR
ncbi:hypothetical protein [Massilia sp. TSP1-1-2]|uniref:hypothetical protein n=1 Tax=Massilia sp. TSP1-1-2 TaxID=2804649 RepID=UPI003CEFA656